MGTDAAAVWNSAGRVLAGQVSETVWNSTFSELDATELDDDVLTLSVPSEILRQRIEQRYRELIEAVLADDGHTSLKVAFEVRVHPATITGTLDDRRGDVPVDDPTDSSTERTAHRPATHSTERTVEVTGAPDARSTENPPVTAVRPYTFDSFVTGPSNRFAHAAALAVAETPARNYNPLFVYGGAGLGKTHLLYAISGYVRRNYSSFRVRYISTETMLNEFVEAIRNGTQQDFKQRYREIDVLLVDDIQFLEGKEQLQEEFFYTFNSLHDAQRQIVLSSDRPPDAIATLEDRLRSRFKMGLITDIQPPDFETRLAILRKKGDQTSSRVPPEVLEFIATNITYNIRELEGALIRVNAYAKHHDTELSVPLAHTVLADVLRASKPRLITAEMIIEAAGEQFGFTHEQICSRRRTRDLVHARQVSMYVCRELTDLSYPQIGAAYGGKDHTTVLYAYEKISKHMDERLKNYEDVTALIQTLLSGR